MTLPTITGCLKYANLQMAVEAFIRNERGVVFANSGQLSIDAPARDNEHVFRFIESGAKKFNSEREIIDPHPNAGTRFSRTLHS